MYTVYILKSIKNGKYYVGFTSNLEKRLRKHNSNSGGFTKKKGPWILVYKEEFSDKKSAWLREQQIKRYKGGNSFKRLIKLWRGGRAV